MAYRFAMLAMLLLWASCAAAQPAPLDLGEIVVTAGRRPEDSGRIARRVSVVSREDIESLPATSVQELLEYAAGVDVKQRAPGVQADFHMQGGGFEQTAVLVDGVRVNDPQTGHHNADIPVALEDIERIEILHGQGGALYGPDAVGGVINIVTRAPDGGSRAWFRAGAGSHSLRSAHAGASGPSWRLSAERTDSGGFREGTGHGISMLRYDKYTGASDSRTRVTAGWTDKLFGAHSFYVPGWASRERTQTQTLDVKHTVHTHTGVLSLDAYMRGHNDRFECSTANPALCLNRHRTLKTGVEIVLATGSAEGARRMTMGLLAEHDRLASSNMGGHNRDRAAAFLQTGARLSRRLNMEAGLRADGTQGYGTQWAHSMSVGWSASPDVKLYASHGRSFRIPSYTELFYRDPAHLAPGSLQPETAASREAGARVMLGNATLDVTLFTRRTYHFIDWRRATSAAPWLIGNNAVSRCRGASSEIRRTVRGADQISLSHDAVSCRLPGGDEFKYADTRPRHILRAGYRRSAWSGTLDVRMRYEKPRRGEHIVLADLAWRRERAQRILTLQISNLFDRDYEDVPGAAMPGRTAVIQMQWNR